MNQNWLTTLTSLKAFLNITASTDDSTLSSLILIASLIIEAELKRKIRLRSHTEYYDGKGDKNIFVPHRPIVSITSLYDDVERGWGTDSLIATTDYSFDPYSGEIYLYYGKNYFDDGIKNVRIIYQGGYEEFIIESGINDKIDFNIGGSELTATLTAGTYGSGTLMCAQIVSAFEAAEDTGIYSATYSPLTAKFTITKSTGTFQIKWSTGSHASQGAGATLGFSADDTGSLTYTSDNEVLGIPDNIQHACNMLVAHLYNQSKKGMGYVDQESFNIGNQSFRPSQKAVPNNVLEIISQYRNINI